jgi:glutamine amidotransferase
MLAIIDYGAGNIGSVQRACAETGIQSFITANPGDLKNAERIIFPGVGAAPTPGKIIRSAFFKSPGLAVIKD